jgi:glycosyltransferase involved in cell wall biosynthesis
MLAMVVILFFNLSAFLCHRMLILWMFMAGVVIQCGYALYLFVRIFRLPVSKPIEDGGQKGVSVIICGKNEAANLRKYLPTILSQRYGPDNRPSYEVIVVNDASTDDTARVLQELQQQYGHLKVVHIPLDATRDLKGKKYALSVGVAQAQHDRLVLTDADCAPASDRWLQHMAAPLNNGKHIVAGYGGYNERPGLLNAFIRWETMHTFLQYSTYTLAGMPYMAVGRNMACTKDILLKAQKNELWNLLPSGDDDLLVRLEGNSANTAIVSDAASFTYSDAKSTWTEWIRQKQRHLSTGKYYKTNIKMLLGGYGLSHAIMWLGFAVSLCCCPAAVLVLMGIRCILYRVLWGVTAHKLGEKKLALWFPLFDIGWMIYNFAFLPYITLKNKQEWK